MRPHPNPLPAGRDYAYDSNRPHAVNAVDSSQLAVGSYQYDQNGNMTCRMENGSGFIQSYNAENRLSNVSKLDGDCSSGTIIESWLFAYDGDGNRTTQFHFTGLPFQGASQSTTPDSVTAYFMGGSYEVSGTIVNSTLTESGSIKYYSLAGQMIALRDSSDSTGLKYLLTDHLGSVVAITDAGGALVSQQRYLPFGEVRSDLNPPYIMQTDFGYTGQRANSYIKLIDFKARWLDPELGRFIQPDSIIQDPSNPQTWNRFSYVQNRPVLLNDPTGHTSCLGDNWDDGPQCVTNPASSWRYPDQPARRKNIGEADFDDIESDLRGEIDRLKSDKLRQGYYNLRYRMAGTFIGYVLRCTAGGAVSGPVGTAACMTLGYAAGQAANYYINKVAPTDEMKYDEVLGALIQANKKNNGQDVTVIVDRKTEKFAPYSYDFSISGITDKPINLTVGQAEFINYILGGSLIP